MDSDRISSVKERGEQLNAVENTDGSGEVMIGEPETVEEVKRRACVNRGGVEKFNIDESKAEGLGATQEIVYVQCGNGEKREYRFDIKFEAVKEKPEEAGEKVD